MQSGFLFLGALSAMIGVAMGAFGAHGLKDVLTPEHLAVYHTAVDYQLWHALGLIAIGLFQQQTADSRLLSWAGKFMFLGIVLFSGSLYSLVLMNNNWMGMITPIGGVCFLIAWLLFAIYGAKQKHLGRYK